MYKTSPLAWKKPEEKGEETEIRGREKEKKGGGRVQRTWEEKGAATRMKRIRDTLALSSPFLCVHRVRAFEKVPQARDSPPPPLPLPLFRNACTGMSSLRGANAGALICSLAKCPAARACYWYLTKFRRCSHLHTRKFRVLRHDFHVSP